MVMSTFSDMCFGSKNEMSTVIVMLKCLDSTDFILIVTTDVKNIKDYSVLLLQHKIMF